ncbi:hypothetical protein HDV05_003952 [Chytridiales sp. JEL 0842]|nr:hypothetical protein HDV05_003952 [Chytridiales sp. JEL 0842]
MPTVLPLLLSLLLLFAPPTPTLAQKPCNPQTPSTCVTPTNPTGQCLPPGFCTEPLGGVCGGLVGISCSPGLVCQMPSQEGGEVVNDGFGVCVSESTKTTTTTATKTRSSGGSTSTSTSTSTTATTTDIPRASATSGVRKTRDGRGVGVGAGMVLLGILGI